MKKSGLVTIHSKISLDYITVTLKYSYLWIFSIDTLSRLVFCSLRLKKSWRPPPLAQSSPLCQTPFPWMVGVQSQAWGATLHPWTVSTDRGLEEACQWTTPPTPCPATTTTDLQGATMITAVDPQLRPMQASTGVLAWMIATGKIKGKDHNLTQ